MPAGAYRLYGRAVYGEGAGVRGECSGERISGHKRSIINIYLYLLNGDFLLYRKLLQY